MMDFISKWKDRIAQVADVEIKLIKLGIIERVAKLMSYFIFTIIVLFLLLCIFLFLGIGMGEWFGNLTGSRPAGFFITIGVYFLLIFIIYLLRNVIIKVFSGKFIGVLTESDKEESDTRDDKKNSNK